MNPNRHSLGLLDSYTGGNFGDGAIQDAVMNNLRRRNPDCSFHLISLDPDRTTQIHRVPSHPLTTAVFLANRAKSSAHSPPAERPLVTPVPGRKAGSALIEPLRLKALLRKFRLDRWGLAKKPLYLAGYLANELRHIRAIRHLLRDFRLLIVSGGGQLDDYWGGPMGQPYSLLKWALLARIGRVPVVFLSVGVDRLEHRLSRRFIQWALKLAVYRSYRDVGSKPLLADMPFTQTDPVIPDLAFSFDLTTLIPPATNNGNKLQMHVGISPMAYMLKGHWPREDARIFEPYFDALTEFTTGLLAQGHKITLFATAAADNFATRMLQERLETMAPGQQSQIRRITAGCLQELLPAFADLDAVVASRLHGVILSHLARKPVLSISYDRKVSQYMRDMNQTPFCLDIHNVQIHELRETFSLLRGAQAAIQTTLAERIATFQPLLANQYDHIMSLTAG
jgi:polysaccharide pyruvyl transferase WcaK-like protein